MPTERKVQQVADLEDRLTRAVMAIGLDYRGLSVGQMRALRLTLRAQEPTMELRVVKNTLLQRAAANAGKPGVSEIAIQATALVLGYEEEVAPPKALKKYLRESRIEIPIHGGYLDGDVLTAAEVDELASVPSRLELMAKLAGGLNSPVGGIAGGLHALLRQLAAIIDARAEQLVAETGEPPAEADESDGADAPPPTEDPAPEETTPGQDAPEAAVPPAGAEASDSDSDSDSDQTDSESSDE